MNLNIFQVTNPVGAGNTLVMAIYKASASSTLVNSFPLPGPYTGQTQLHTFLGLQNVVYDYILFESPDAGPDGVQRVTFEVQPNQNAYNVRDDLYLVADTSPGLASGTTFYGPDSSLVGWNWGIEQPGGVGTLQYGVSYVKTVGGVDTTQDDTTATGWRFLDTTNLIGPSQAFVIHFLPQLTATSTPASGTFIAGTQLLTSNTTLDNTAAGQSYLLEGGGGVIAISLPDIATVPDNEPIFFSSNGGSHVNAALVCFSGQQFQWYDNQTNLGSNTYASTIYLGQGEDVFIYRFTYPGGAKRWIVKGDTAGMRYTGEHVYDYSRIPLNAVFANGQLLSRANYARLWAWVQNLESGLLISDSSYNHTTTVNGVTYLDNQGKYTAGDGSTSFRVPTLWRYGLLKAKNGSPGGLSVNGLPGDFLAQSIGTHDHLTHGKGAIWDNSTHPSPSWYLSIGNGSYAGPGGNLFGRASAPDTNMRTSDNFNGNAAGENLPSTTGIYALIRT